MAPAGAFFSYQLELQRTGSNLKSATPSYGKYHGLRRMGNLLVYIFLDHDAVDWAVILRKRAR